MTASDDVESSPERAVDGHSGRHEHRQDQRRRPNDVGAGRESLDPALSSNRRMTDFAAIPTVSAAVEDVEHGLQAGMAAVSDAGTPCVVVENVSLREFRQRRVV